MSGRDTSAEEIWRADVALFVINPDVPAGVGSLAVATVAGERGEFALLSTRMAKTSPSADEMAKRTVRQAMRGSAAKSWPAPLLWETGQASEFDHQDGKTRRIFGFAGVAHDVPPGTILMAPERLVSDTSLPVSTVVRTVVQKGLESLQSPERLEWRTYATTSGKKNALLTAARLLSSDPESFTTTDLRKVFEAVSGEELDPGNFRRDIRGNEWMGLVDTGYVRTGGIGAPPELLSMPAHVLEALGERPH